MMLFLCNTFSGSLKEKYALELSMKCQVALLFKLFVLTYFTTRRYDRVNGEYIISQI